MSRWGTPRRGAVTQGCMYSYISNSFENSLLSPTTKSNVCTYKGGKPRISLWATSKSGSPGSALVSEREHGGHLQVYGHSWTPAGARAGRMLRAVSDSRALPPRRANTLSPGIHHSEGEVSAASPTPQKHLKRSPGLRTPTQRVWAKGQLRECSPQTPAARSQQALRPRVKRHGLEEAVVFPETEKRALVLCIEAQSVSASLSPSLPAPL